MVKNLIAIPYFPINPVELIMIVTVISEKKLSPKLIFADQNIIVHEYVKVGKIFNLVFKLIMVLI